jgi:four helix bundle protein
VCSNISEAWRKRRYKPAFISKLSDAETEAAEMQCWFDVALKLNYMPSERHASLDGRYEHVIAQLVTMMNDADRWCAL